MLGGKSGRRLRNNRGNKNNVTNFLFCLTIVSLLSACYNCYNNQIWYEPETNTVYSVDNYPIRTLDVVLEKSKMSFWVANVNTSEASSRIKLDSLGKHYKIIEEKSDYPQQERYENIPFVPSEKYEIYHASGDASSCTIYFYTDENCKVNKVKRWYEENCQDKGLQK